MFSEYVLGQYLTLISDVISWVERVLETFHVRKIIQFSETEEAANADCTKCSNKHLYTNFFFYKHTSETTLR